MLRILKHARMPSMVLSFGQNMLSTMLALCSKTSKTFTLVLLKHWDYWAYFLDMLIIFLYDKMLVRLAIKSYHIDEESFCLDSPETISKIQYSMTFTFFISNGLDSFHT